MSNPSKQKGTAAEGLVLEWLTGITGAPMHRLVQHGSRDIGDLGGIEGVVLEVKSGQPDVRAWLRETEVERRNADASLAFCIWRTPGTTNPADWLVFYDPDQRSAFSARSAPISGPQRLFPLHVRTVAAWACHAALRFDGRLPGPSSTDAYAMTGQQFEPWLCELVARLDSPSFPKLSLREPSPTRSCARCFHGMHIDPCPLCSCNDYLPALPRESSPQSS